MTNIKSVNLGVPNGIVFIADATGGVAPEPVRGALFGSSSSCITVACEIDCEGRTELSLGGMMKVDPGRPAAFQATIAVSTNSVGVFLVSGQQILRLPIKAAQALVRIWTDEPQQARRVVIGVQPA